MRPWSLAISLRWAVALLSLSATLPARADTWRVDLIVFRYLGDAEEQGQPPASPKQTGAIELGDTQRLSAAGITLLPATDFALAPHWSSLRVSSQFRPLIKLAWTQNNPPSENGPRLRLRAGEKFTLNDAAMGAREMQEIDGTVGLNLSRFLHLNTDLIFTEPGQPGVSWMLTERRRMRSEELHHLDSPRIGVIARVVKWAPVP
ncbi:MAG: CsiV family protein [Panacagrimonas sp.]